MKLTVRESYFGVKFAMFSAFIMFVAGLGSLTGGNADEFGIRGWGAIMLLLGVGMYVLRKKRLLGEAVRGSKILEIVLFAIILIQFIAAIAQGAWQHYPIIYGVVPAWSLAAYIYLVFAEVEKN